MKIIDLSIVELKVAWDFVRYDLKDLEDTAKKENIRTEQIPAYKEVKEIEDKLYHRLLNITRNLE